MGTAYQVPVHIALARWILRPVFRGLFRLLGRVQLSGTENIPRQGAYLIAPNHVSIYDPPVVLAFWPVAAEAVGAIEVWQRTGQASLVRWYGAMPVRRGEYDRQVLDKMQAALISGRPLMIMPEGGRSHTPGLRRGEPGVAFLVEKTGVPVLPVGVTGTTDDFLKRALRGGRPVVRISIGEAMHLPQLVGKGELRRLTRQQNVDLIMYHIAALLPSEYQGVYAKPASLLA